MTLTIGISGPSSSGKSTVARNLARWFDGEILGQDRFVVDPAECRPGSNFCDPRFLHSGAFVSAVQLLSSEGRVAVPELDSRTFRGIGTRELDARDASLVIVEGMPIFRYPEVAARLSRAYYLMVSLRTLCKRNLLRDMSQRGKTKAEVLSQMSWVESELALDERSISGGYFARLGVTVVEAESLTAATEAIGMDVLEMLRSG